MLFDPLILTPFSINNTIYSIQISITIMVHETCVRSLGTVYGQTYFFTGEDVDWIEASDSIVDPVDLNIVSLIAIFVVVFVWSFFANVVSVMNPFRFSNGSFVDGILVFLFPNDIILRRPFFISGPTTAYTRAKIMSTHMMERQGIGCGMWERLCRE